MPNDEENLIAERVVSLEPARDLTVRISQSEVEDFWRVDVTRPSGARRHLSTTVGPGDSFMMDLIRDAVSGEQVAWRDLARWGHRNLSRSDYRFA